MHAQTMVKASETATMEAWTPWLILFAADVLLIPVACHLLPGPIPPGSTKQIVLTIGGALLNAVLATYFISAGTDPYPYGILYSGALMVLCVEVWWFEDPQLFNGTKLKGWPFFLFHQPGGADTKAPVPMTGFTRVFGSWHAGGVSLSFFIHVLAFGFPPQEKAKVALALGLLWVIWASINQWRAWYGAAQFCQTGIMFHSLTGPGCGLCGYLLLGYWVQNRVGDYQSGEIVVLSTFGLFCIVSLWWLLTHERTEAVPDKPESSEGALGATLAERS